jgi:hypothetical protein
VTDQFHGYHHGSLLFPVLDYLDAVQDPVAHQIAVEAIIQNLALDVDAGIHQFIGRVWALHELQNDV